MTNSSDIDRQKNELLKKCLTQKNISFEWKQDFTHAFLTIEIPSLADNQFEVWGDWGPMYKFQMSPQRLIKISSQKSLDETPKTHYLENKEIFLNSPIDSDIRKIWPLYFSFDDSAMDLSYEIYLNKEAQAQKIIIYRKSSQTSIFESESLTTT